MNTKTNELPEQPVTCDDKETIIRNLLLERYQLQQEVSILRDELARLNKALATRPHSPCTTET
jgi:hypothetical protein